MMPKEREERRISRNAIRFFSSHTFSSPQKHEHSENFLPPEVFPSEVIRNSRLALARISRRLREPSQVLSKSKGRKAKRNKHNAGGMSYVRAAKEAETPCFQPRLGNYTSEQDFMEKADILKSAGACCSSSATRGYGKRRVIHDTRQ